VLDEPHRLSNRRLRKVSGKGGVLHDHHPRTASLHSPFGWSHEYANVGVGSFAAASADCSTPARALACTALPSGAARGTRCRCFSIQFTERCVEWPPVARDCAVVPRRRVGHHRLVTVAIAGAHQVYPFIGLVEVHELERHLLLISFHTSGFDVSDSIESGR
jgi:hypothetical protein